MSAPRPGFVVTAGRRAKVFKIRTVPSVDPRDQRGAHGGCQCLRVGTALPFADASFDPVVSSRVIEHADNAAVHIHEQARVLRPGGLVYLVTPNRPWPWNDQLQSVVFPGACRRATGMGAPS